ncbi:hypothetical protein BGX26_006702 [Mortierella sp. AD094]|nr:hypothetical protein BGX26_006702 [Mortierella sp. AD094]
MALHTTYASSCLPSDQLLPASEVISTSPAPSRIFTEEAHPPLANLKLPEPEERLDDTRQLANCLGLLQNASLLDDDTDDSISKWVSATQNNPEEKERLETLATDVIRAFFQDELKDAKSIEEVTCLAPILDKCDFRNLLSHVVNKFEQSSLLDLHLLGGLPQLIQSARPNFLEADDLVRILVILSERLMETHDQCVYYIYHLTETLSNVLDAMADSQVEGLSREKLHEPLSAHLNFIRARDEECLVYQAAYAFQALQYVPDDETPWQKLLRLGGNVVWGITGVVSAVRRLDLEDFIKSLSQFQEGVIGAGEVMAVAKENFNNVAELHKDGKTLLESIREGICVDLKKPWYTALRGTDALLRQGQLKEFETLVYDAPCKSDPAFQWGICDRLGHLASSHNWEYSTRQRAIALLGRIYKNDVWGDKDSSVNERIVCILKYLVSIEVDMKDASTLLEDLEIHVNSNTQSDDQTCRDESALFKIPSRPSTSNRQSLLDRVQHKPDYEGAVRRLRLHKLEKCQTEIYIAPQAKASLKASDNTLFPLMEEVKNFLASDRKVFLLLGDSGAGKSTFTKALEHDLWHGYKKGHDQIPLHIHLPAIDKPEHDLIDKQLRRCYFSERQIIEMKEECEFILICDGYDESLQTHNLYTCNHLNELGQWRAKMVISCRTEYIGRDYQKSFQTADRNHSTKLSMFQEAVIAPFSRVQIREYIEKYISTGESTWKCADYNQVFDRTPQLLGLVKNPFLLNMSLYVLPKMVDPSDDLTVFPINRVLLYDQFVKLWLERNQKRLQERTLSDQERIVFQQLSSEGFGSNSMNFLKDVAVAIYERQERNPVVEYLHHRDKGTWKEEFFSWIDEVKILREALPLTNSGSHFRFLHRSLLEYGIARAIFEPLESDDDLEPIFIHGRHQSRGSVFRLQNRDTTDGMAFSIGQPLLDSPLARNDFTKERSILQFLVGRAQQESSFKQQLLEVIERSKTDETAALAAANAITILVRAGLQFNGADLRGIRIPKADLSHGVFDFAQLQGADLEGANLRNVWLREANLDGAQMKGVEFGEFPFLQEDKGVSSCAYSQDGKIFAVGLSNGNISVYTTSNWEKIKTFSCNGSRLVSSIAISPTSSRLASGYGSAVKIWDIDLGACHQTLIGHDGPVLRVLYSPKGDLIVSSSTGYSVRLWDAETGDCVSILSAHSGCITALVFSPTGNQLASGSEDATLRLWNVETGTCLPPLSGHVKGVSSIDFSPLGDRIVSVSGYGTLRLWDTKTGDCRRVLNRLNESFQCAAFSPKGDQIVTGSGKVLQLWDVETGNCRQVMCEHIERIRMVLFSPKGNQVASSSDDKTVRLWDVESGVCTQALRGHTDVVKYFVYSPSGNYISSCGADKTVRFWEVNCGTPHNTVNSHNDAVLRVAFTSTGDKIASGSRDNTVQLWDVGTGACHFVRSGRSGPAQNVIYSPSGHRSAPGKGDRTVQLWDFGSERSCRKLSINSSLFRRFVYSQNGDRMASGCDDGTVRLWDVQSGTCLHTLRGHSKCARIIIFSPSGSLVAFVGLDSTVRLWDVETGVRRHFLRGHKGRVMGINFSPDGNQIASGSCDKTVRLWDVETGDCYHTLVGHTRWVWVVKYSPNGKQIASGSDDCTIRLWNVETGDCQHVLSGHTKWIRSAVYSPYGNLVASGSCDMAVRLWDVESGQCKAVIRNFKGVVNSIAWRATCGFNYLATGCNDRSVRLWQVVEEEDRCEVRLHWSTTHDELSVANMSMQGVQGLSYLNMHLLKQRGAIGEPHFIEYI